jgi:hypothetical protein
MFHVGQKVVCIKEGTWSWERNWPEYVRLFRIVHPRKGDVLTCRTVEYDEKGCGLRFFEIRNPFTPTSTGGDMAECSFDGARFRPVEERKTDISVFTKILDDVKTKEPV